MSILSCRAAVLLPALALLAAPAPGQGPRHLREPQALSDRQLHEAHALLQSIKLTLEAADHDYGGHRAAAVHDIGAAEHQLHQALAHGRHGAGHGANANHPGIPHPEPQALSDRQLAAAVPALKLVAAALQAADHDYGGHRARAVAHLATAIAQLETALKYSALKDRNNP
jgi:hypothetical protein